MNAVMERPRRSLDQPDEAEGQRVVDPQRAVDHIYKNGIVLAQAKANRVYVEEYRKSLKAILMKQSGESSVAAQEREAYSHPDYLKHLDAIKQAVLEEETARWGIVAAETRVEVWRSQEASNRRIDRAAQ